MYGGTVSKVTALDIETFGVVAVGVDLVDAVDRAAANREPHAHKPRI